MNVPSFHSASPPSHTLEHLPPASPGQALGREESDSSLPWRGSQSVPREGNKEAFKERCYLRGLMGGVGVGHVDGGRWVGWRSGQKEELIPALHVPGLSPPTAPKGKGSLASGLLRVIGGVTEPK